MPILLKLLRSPIATAAHEKRHGTSNQLGLDMSHLLDTNMVLEVMYQNIDILKVLNIAAHWFRQNSFYICLYLSLACDFGTISEINGKYESRPESNPLEVILQFPDIYFESLE